MRAISITAFVLALTTLMRPASPSISADEPLLLEWDIRQLEASRLQIARQASSAVRAWQQLQARANEALTLTPPTVMNKPDVPPSGDKHDYQSFGPYWWPDPTKEDGLPYIRRDGEVNPESRGPASDWQSLQTMTTAVRSLSLAYYFSNDERYAAKASKLLLSWFLDPDTRMNPHLRFGQAIPGRTQGRGIGLIETRYFLHVIESAGLLAASEHWSEDNDRQLRAWFREFLEWMLTSRHGRDEDNTRNNHGTWYDAQVVAFAWFTGQEDLARERLRGVASRRIDTQIEPDGRQPHELARTRSFTYSAFNAQGFVTLATYGKRLNVNLWGHRGAQGQSIPTAVQYLARFADPDIEWKHKQITKPDRSERLQPLLAQTAVEFNSQQSREVLRNISPQEPAPFIARLLWPTAWPDRE